MTLTDEGDFVMLQKESEYSKTLLKMKGNMYGFACVCCAKEITPGDFYSICNDCGAMFCKKCTLDGELENHVCDPDEEWEGE